MLPDAEDYFLPHDAEDYTVYVEPSGPNMARNTSADGLTFLRTFAAVLLLVFTVGCLFAMGAKKFRVWRPLSFLILFVSFVSALLDFSGVRGYLTGVNGMPVATMQHIERRCSI